MYSKVTPQEIPIIYIYKLINQLIIIVQNLIIVRPLYFLDLFCVDMVRHVSKRDRSKKTREQRDTDTDTQTKRERERERERDGVYGSENADSGGESKRQRRGEAESEIVLGEIIEERFRVKVA